MAVSSSANVAVPSEPTATGSTSTPPGVQRTRRKFHCSGTGALTRNQPSACQGASTAPGSSRPIRGTLMFLTANPWPL